MSTIAQALSGVSKLGIDTAPIIYFIESNPAYDSRITPVFEMLESGAITGVTSAISLTEVLTLPVRLGQTHLYLQYRDLLVNSAHLDIVPVDISVAERASVLRAQFSLRTPDALQLAAAVEAGCGAFLTNDAKLSKVNAIPVILLHDLAS